MKIFVASSAELREERMELVDLMLDLNDELEGQGSKLKPVLWEFMDSSMGTKHKEKEYLEKLRECEICLVLFWKNLGKYTVIELNAAVKEMNAGKLPKKVVALFKEPADGIKYDLDDFKRSFSQNYPSIPVKKFQNIKELRELAAEIVKDSSSNSPKERDETGVQKGTSGLKEIKVMIAASEELHKEKMDFSGLIANLNEVLAPRDIELKRVKWNPEVDGSLEDYQKKLHDCEMCLTLYWHDLVGNSQEEMDTAYRELKAEKNPRKLYVFFKEPSENLTKLLGDFKANFETRYGHFFCKFENVDTMNLNFILRFEAYQNDLNKDFVKISKGKVIIGGNEMVDLDKVPFAAFNEEYRRLQGELVDLNKQLAEARRKHIEDSENEDLEDEFIDAKSKRNKLAEEFEKYQNHLYDIALNFAKMSGERCSERMRMAREQFEMGNNIVADEILNMAEMKREAERESEQFDQSKNNLELKVEEFRLKANTVMANTLLSVPIRFSIACEAFQEAIKYAKKIDYDTIEYAKILFDYAHLLQQFNKMHEAVKYYEESLRIYHNLAKKQPNIYNYYVAITLNNLAVLHKDLNRYVEAENEYKEALEIRQGMAKDEHGAYIGYVADILNNLGLLHKELNRYVEAENEYKEALEIRQGMAKDKHGAYIGYVADTLNNLAILHSDLNRHDEAEAEYKEALEIRRGLVKNNLDAYKKDVAYTLNNLANLHYNINRTDEAEAEYKEALEIWRELVENNPDAYRANLAATLNNLAILHDNPNRHNEAEEEYKEALVIWRRLAKEYPDAYMDKVAITQNNLAILHNKLNRHDEAEGEYKVVLEIIEELDMKKHDAYRAFAATTLNNLGILHFDINRPDEAEAEYKEALKIRRGLAKDNPDAYIGYVADTLNNLAILHNKLNRPVEATVELKEALDIRRGLAKKKPEAYIVKVTITLNQLAYFYASQNDFSKAIEAIDDAIFLMPKVAEYYDTKGVILLMSGDVKGAVAMWRKVMALDSDFQSKHNGETELHRQLKDRGLIEK